MTQIRPYEYDTQYLFRLTSTFGWDETISLCESLVHDIEVALLLVAESNSIGDDDDETSTSENDENNYFNDSLSCFDGDDEGGGSHNSSSNNHNSNSGSLHTHHHHRQLRQSLRSAHSQLYYMDQWGNTPLHAASYVKPPLRVIEALFRVGRLLWRYNSCYMSHDYHIVVKDEAMHGVAETLATPIWARLCTDGSTPFLGTSHCHSVSMDINSMIDISQCTTLYLFTLSYLYNKVACSTGASLSVLHCYLDEIEYYNMEQPHWLLPSLFNHYSKKMTVLLPDNQGNSPLMGYMSFHQHWISRNSTEFHRGPNGASVAEEEGTGAAPPLQDYWNLACRMLRFATPTPSISAIEEHVGEEELSTIDLVHRCAAIAKYCPVSLLEWVVSLSPRYAIENASDADYETTNSQGGGGGSWVPRGWFPGDVCAAMKDDEGKLPFHRALEDVGGEVDSSSTICNYKSTEGSSFSSSNNNNFHRKLERNRVQIIQKLLRWYPEAARTALPNGRSPLLHAIAQGGAWHRIGSSTSNYNTFTNGANEKETDSHLGLLQLLWRYSPEQSLEIDPISGLYPFMLAATVRLTEKQFSRQERLGQERVVVENVYNLLRKNPQIILSSGLAS